MQIQLVGGGPGEGDSKLIDHMTFYFLSESEKKMNSRGRDQTQWKRKGKENRERTWESKKCWDLMWV